MLYVHSEYSVNNDASLLPIKTASYPCIIPILSGYNGLIENSLAGRRLGCQSRVLTTIKGVGSEINKTIANVELDVTAYINTQDVSATSHYNTKLPSFDTISKYSVIHGLDLAIRPKWMSLKPVVRGVLKNVGKDTVTLRYYTGCNENDYVDYTTSNFYIRNKVRELIYAHIIRPDTLSAPPAQIKELLKQILKESIEDSTLDTLSIQLQNYSWRWPYLLCDEEYMKDTGYDFLELVSLGVYDSPIKLPSKKPFLAPASFKLKVIPKICVWIKAGELLTDVKCFAATFGQTEEEFKKLILDYYNEKGKTSAVTAKDSYDSCVLCLGTLYTKAGSADDVLKRAIAQETKL